MSDLAPVRPDTRFSVRDLRRRVNRDASFIDHPEGDGDHRFNPENGHLLLERTFQDAAVLIPVVDHVDGATVILTKRAETLRAHTGQVAFPGGRIDPEDATPEAAALREAFEEIGLDARSVEVLGRLPDYLSASGYRISPVIGIVTPGFELAINSDEVDAAFEVPLSFLMDPQNHVRESRRFNDREWIYYDMRYDERRVWGVTAGIIRTFYERFYA